MHFKERLKGLIGHWVTIDVETPSGEGMTFEGILEEVDDDTIVLRHGNVKQYITNVTITYINDFGAVEDE